MGEKTRVTVEGGKYTWEVQDGKVSCLRFGEPWLDDVEMGTKGIKAVMALIFELDEALERLCTCPRLEFTERGIEHRVGCPSIIKG